MSGLSGFCNFDGHYLAQKETYNYLLERMGATLAHRGQSKVRYHVGDHIGVSVRHGGAASMDIEQLGRFAIVSDSEIYNAAELRHLLASKGFTCKTSDNAEIILSCYLHYGDQCATMINGVFAFAIWDEQEQTLFLCRDRMGIKPLFYTIINGTLVFASEIKALFDFPGINARIDEAGLCEIFGLLPSRTEGNGVFKDIKEIKYGHIGIYHDHTFKETCYWDVTKLKNDFTHEEAVAHTRYLVTDAVKRQMETSLPFCTFLSGGIDSSIVTAIASKECEGQGQTLDTFSFDYEENETHFQSNDFQGDTDKKWAIQVSELYKTNHNFVECSIKDLVSNLYPAVVARDLPGMADIDASLLYFCKKVAKTHGVALTGECADELFGGYPWFHSPDVLNAHSFPWIRQADFRKTLLSPDLLAKIDIDAYVAERYNETVARVAALEEEGCEEKSRLAMAYLNIKWFMPNLIDRTERMGMHASFIGRVPYADYRIVEFLWNLPWDIKCNGTPKSLLREAFTDLLPEALINRRKSPFPKTYHPQYERLLKQKMTQILDDPSSPLLPLINKDAMIDFLTIPADYGKPWYGQLMAAPQLIAFYIQIEYWLRKYCVSIL